MSICTCRYELGCGLYYKPIWRLTVNERGHNADSEDTILFKLKTVLPKCWATKVSKNRINCTYLCSCTHHVIKSHGSRD